MDLLGTYLSLLATSLSAILIVMFGALMIGAGDLTMGQLIAVSMLAARAITPATQIAALIVRYEQTRQALEALDKIMESPTDEGADSLHLPRMSGRIDFRDTHFAYPDSAPVLKGLNLSIRPGERVGFIGRIGSGKSTLFKLLLNLYSPDQGAVMVDGMAVSQLEPQSLRRQVGYVPQDVVLFHGDIRENILLGGTVSDAQLSKPCACPASTRPCRRCPTASAPRWASGATASPAASARPSPSPGRWCSSRACCCSTSPPA
jgi:ATP-binding cassette subfamily C protein LapB